MCARRKYMYSYSFVRKSKENEDRQKVFGNFKHVRDIPVFRS